MSISYLRKVGNADAFFDTEGYGLVKGAALQALFPAVTSVSAGAAVGTVQSRLHIPFPHRLRGVYATANSGTAVAGGTDPAFDVYRHLSAPTTAPTAALISPAAAGNVDTGAHVYAIAFYNTAGITPPGPIVAITVADKAVNGKVVLSSVPLGPTGTTGRKVYRSAAGATALLLLDTITNNTATTYSDNIADSSLGAARESVNGAGATVLSATVKLSESTNDRLLTDQLVAGTLASGVSTTVFPPCTYTLRAVTGASSGAIGILQAYLVVEYVADPA